MFGTLFGIHLKVLESNFSFIFNGKYMFYAKIVLLPKFSLKYFVVFLILIATIISQILINV